MDTTDFDAAQLLETFLAETSEQLVEMEEALVALETQPEDDESVQTIFRAAHTLKGNAASMGFAGVAELAHALEDLLDRMRAHEVAVGHRIVTLLLQAVDALRQLAPEAAAGRQDTHPSQRELLRDLAAYSATSPATPAASAGSEDVAVGSNSAAAAANHHTLRVEVGRLDRMLDLSGEIAVAHGRLAQLLQRSAAGASDELLEIHRDADHIFMDLQEEILRARMVPLGPTFRQQVRTVRDAAQASGKLARLVLEGEDVEVDTTIVEQLRGPITHMVRNALDHGIEAQDVRVARGKDHRGQISLRARHEAGGVVIEIADDGAGLDHERIAAKARTLGLAPNPEAMGEQDLLGLLFEPGFSTSASVTELSGRGIGMDVVRRNVEALRGTVAVQSSPGAGTTFTIRVPLTVAIIQGFLVAAGGETYVIPLEAVLECVDFPAEDGRGGGSGVIRLREHAVPYLRLREALGIPGAPPARESLVVVAHEGRKAALAVDALLGESQIVIKSFGRLLEDVPGVAGSTILGSGRVALILDVAVLIQSASQAEACQGESALSL